jgi:hypothetical protein
MKNNKILKIVVFIIFGIPGALLFVFSGMLLIGKIMTQDSVHHPSEIYTSTGCIIGLIFTLVSVDKIKQWLYSLVFISIPISFWVYSLLNPKAIGGTFPLLAFVGIIAFLVFNYIKQHYKKANSSLSL